MDKTYQKIRSNRWINLFVINLRYLIGFGFLPSGMVKILNNPFTHPENTGIFFDYLDALYTTGFYYNMIGYMQFLAAILLITQRFATLGALIFLPIIFNISVLTLSTIGSLTPLVTVLMLLGIIFFLLWDHYKWMHIFSKDNFLHPMPKNLDFPTYHPIHMYTGVGIVLFPLLLYFSSLPKAIIPSLVVLVLLGNILAEWKTRQPIIRRTKFY